MQSIPQRAVQWVQEENTQLTTQVGLTLQAHVGTEIVFGMLKMTAAIRTAEGVPQDIKVSLSQMQRRHHPILVALVVHGIIMQDEHAALRRRLGLPLC